MDAVLVFDEAESLFGSRGQSMESSTDRYAAMDVGILLHHLENHIGIVVLITTKPSFPRPSLPASHTFRS